MLISMRLAKKSTKRLGVVGCEGPYWKTRQYGSNLEIFSGCLMPWLLPSGPYNIQDSGDGWKNPWLCLHLCFWGSHTFLRLSSSSSYYSSLFQLPSRWKLEGQFSYIELRTRIQRTPLWNTYHHNNFTFLYNIVALITLWPIVQVGFYEKRC